jgi:hypothetical protein
MYSGPAWPTQQQQHWLQPGWSPHHPQPWQQQQQQNHEQAWKRHRLGDNASSQPRQGALKQQQQQQQPAPLTRKQQKRQQQQQQQQPTEPFSFLQLPQIAMSAVAAQLDELQRRQLAEAVMLASPAAAVAVLSGIHKMQLPVATDYAYVASGARLPRALQQTQSQFDAPRCLTALERLQELTMVLHISGNGSYQHRSGGCLKEAGRAMCRQQSQPTAIAALR